jgi:predicted transcriptional regulator YdeE
MEYSLIETQEIKVIGIQVRTKNEEEMGGNGRISKLIQEFHTRQLIHQIPNCEENCILSVYTEYDSDEHGYYTYFIGGKVKNLDVIPEGMAGMVIPAARYAVLTSVVGRIPDIVLEGWQHIWQDEDLRKRRAYTADFEMYDERSRDINCAQLDIYIAVKE